MARGREREIEREYCVGGWAEWHPFFPWACGLGALADYFTYILREAAMHATYDAIMRHIISFFS
jgi:hypothetical protein